MAFRSSLALGAVFLLLGSAALREPAVAQPTAADQADVPNEQTTFKGTVVDDKGAPVAEADIVAAAITDEKFADSTIIQTRSDQNGAFQVAVPTTLKRIQVFAFKEGFIVPRTLAHTAEGPKEWGGGPESPINVTLQRGVPTRVRFVDEGNKPITTAIEDAVGSTFLLQYQTAPPVGLLPLARSDADGWMTIRHSEGYIPQALVSAPGFQSVWLHLSAPDDEGLTVRMVHGASVRGRLIGADGKPVPGITLRLQDRQAPIAAAKSDADGRFVLSGLGDDPNFLASTVSDFTLPPTPINTHMPDLGDIRATPGGVISGTITAPDANNGGQPLALNTLSLIVQRADAKPQTPPDPNRPVWRQQVPVDVKGHYSLHLSPGRYTIRLNAWMLPRNQQPTKTIAVREGVTQTLDWTVPKPNWDTPRSLPKPAVETLVGTVKDLKGDPIGAQVSVWHGEERLLSADANADGLWALGALSTAQPPNAYLVQANADGFATAFATVSPSRDTPIALRLFPSKPITVRVTDLQGAPLTGARLEVVSFSVFGAGAWGGSSLLNVPSGALPASILHLAANCNQKGEAILSGLPTGAHIVVKAHCDGYSDGLFVVLLPRTSVVELRLPREITFGGRILLRDPDAPGGGRSLDGAAARAFGLRVKMQAWSGLWLNNWRTGEVGADGAFLIRNIPSLDMIGEPSYSYNLDLANAGGNYPGVTMRYVAPGNNWNLYVTTQEDGKTRHWISYVHGRENGLIYNEGEQVYNDEFLEPLALVRSTIKDWKPDVNPNYAISYHDDRSIYEDWSVKPDKDGHFEIPVPVGTVTLKFPGGQQTLSDLKAGEERDITLAPDKGDPKAPNAAPGAAATRMLVLRVLGPDGATVPRPPLDWKTEQDYGGGQRQAIHGTTDATKRHTPGINSWSRSEMDGQVQFYLQGSDSIEISSPLLDTPQTFTLTKDNTRLTLKLNRLPDRVPPPMIFDEDETFDVDNTAATPKLATIQIGDEVTTLPVAKWLRGNGVLGAAPPQLSVDLKKARGKVVVLVGGNIGKDSGDRLRQLATRFRGQPVVFIAMISPSTPVGDNLLDDMPSSFAIAMDATPAQGENGASMQSLNSPWGTAVIGMDGTLLASSLSEPYLSAAIASALDTVPPPNAP